MTKAAPPKHLRLLRQYIKDLSFENLAPAQTDPTTKPHIQLDIHINAQKQPSQTQERGQNYEVGIQIKAHAKIGKASWFIVELHYAAMCQVGDSPDIAQRSLLLIDTPQQLFPFVRRILADVTRDGGVMPLWLDPIDFAALYEANQKPQAQDQSKNGALTSVKTEDTIRKSPRHSKKPLS